MLTHSHIDSVTLLSNSLLIISCPYVHYVSAMCLKLLITDSSLRNRGYSVAKVEAFFSMKANGAEYSRSRECGAQNNCFHSSENPLCNIKMATIHILRLFFQTVLIGVTNTGSMLQPAAKHSSSVCPAYRMNLSWKTKIMVCVPSFFFFFFCILTRKTLHFSLSKV